MFFFLDKVCVDFNLIIRIELCIKIKMYKGIFVYFFIFVRFILIYIKKWYF